MSPLVFRESLFNGTLKLQLKRLAGWLVSLFVRSLEFSAVDSLFSFSCTVHCTACTGQAREMQRILLNSIIGSFLCTFTWQSAVLSDKECDHI